MLLAMLAPPASASVTVLVGEPFGSFGAMMPNGHTSIYLDRICADGPTKLRMCHPGEPQGVVVARYFHIGDLDWIATPPLEFLYAADRASEIPASATDAQVEALRQAYRARYLQAAMPAEAENAKAWEEWRETAGMAYIRRFWGYELATTREQDERLVAALNAAPNRRRYSVIRANCANFAADIVNFYYPRTVRADHLSDLGILSPKQVARRVATYGKKHPEAELKVIEIAQTPGTLPRSKPVRGGAEGFLKTKRYLAPLLVVQPEVVIGLTAAYLDRGRWQIGRGAEVVGPEEFEPVPGVVSSR
ncbi:hypothetical protein [Granulicella rosea]|uniref:hypothetical protein n=1 Tax=Granulicella rosea TaxID=474952 RepID=UPI000B76E2FB|nr:hypothetical protein [Granulicella rosea]